MNWKMVIALSCFVCPVMVRADSGWVLESSTLTYHISHPLHQVDGVSHDARGKGVCRGGNAIS